jgi:hypothetical protein
VWELLSVIQFRILSFPVRVFKFRCAQILKTRLIGASVVYKQLYFISSEMGYRKCSIWACGGILVLFLARCDMQNVSFEYSLTHEKLEYFTSIFM